jgi:hypothetical protein
VSLASQAAVELPLPLCVLATVGSVPTVLSLLSAHVPLLVAMPVPMVQIIQVLHEMMAFEVEERVPVFP